MRADIHPDYKEAEISCACGAVYNTRSTRGSYKIEICAACHPYYTGDGSMRLVDAAGRIEKFRRRYKKE
ncbi:MAG TPA: 50S ribosomal protein L31, partial [Myxococcales bacterium]|nr:50S ribosomal protein L31 [Myxococcales bacterium]